MKCILSNADKMSMWLAAKINSREIAHKIFSGLSTGEAHCLCIIQKRERKSRAHKEAIRR